MRPGSRPNAALCGLTFELRRARRQTPAGRGRTIYTMTWSGQTVAAVARRRLSEGLGLARRFLAGKQPIDQVNFGVECKKSATGCLPRVFKRLRLLFKLDVFCEAAVEPIS